MNVGAKLTKNCGTLRAAAAAGADCAGAANLPSLASGVRVSRSAQGRISPWNYLLQGCPSCNRASANNHKRGNGQQ